MTFLFEAPGAAAAAKPLRLVEVTRLDPVDPKSRRVLDRNGTVMLAGPSSAINALPGEQKFTPDTQGPACRWFELGEDKTFLSGIVQA